MHGRRQPDHGYAHGAVSQRQRRLLREPRVDLADCLLVFGHDPPRRAQAQTAGDNERPA